MVGPLGMPGRNVFAGLRPLRENERLLDRSMERLASGRLGGGDPSVLVTGAQLDAAIRALDAESRSLVRRADVLSTRDGALGAASELVGELRGLAVSAADSTLSDAERAALEIEAASIVRAIEHTASSATFGGERLFEGSLTGELGATEEGAEEFTLADVGRGLSLGGDAAVVARIAEGAAEDLAVMRGEIGAEIANEIGPRTRALDEEMVRLAGAHSMIVDTDYAAETAALVRADALAQASRHLLMLGAEGSAAAVGLLRSVG